MSKAASSPTARLLQSSRLFSLPRPLPLQPDLNTGVYRASESATTPYPTHQAITTPASSHHRGDWGLKRAIPNKKTESSTPVIRVRANDTYEHITDFMSAGDHVQTERKWAEMGVPLVTPFSALRGRGKHERSVFEDWLDNTDPDAKMESKRTAGGRQARQDAPIQMKRWKYRGPWLAGMQDGEFEQYLQRTIARNTKKEEWRAFLRPKMVEMHLQEAKRQARERNDPLDEEQIAMLEERLQPTEEQLDQYEKELRDDYASASLSSDLTALICEFLDLPGVFASSAALPRITPGVAMSHLDNTGKDSAPATTHPSAGLGFLRTDAILHNHPIYGPQRDKPPVEARVIRPRTRTGAQLDQHAKLGVGGVVADDENTATRGQRDHQYGRRDDRMAHALDENAEGGNRMWVQAERAYIDAKSRIVLATSRARPEAVAIKTGDLDAINEIGQSKYVGGTGMAPTRAEMVAERRNASRAGQGVSGGWDVGMKDSSRMADELFNSVGR